MMRYALLFIIVFNSVPLIALAQSNGVTMPPDSALSEALRTLEGEPIMLEDVIRLAAANSTAAADARASVESARGNMNRERGEFDPELFGEFSSSSSKLPSSSPFSGAAVVHPQTTMGQAGARIKLPFGTELEASVVGTKLETNSAFSSLNPEYDATGSLTFKQPLLNGFGPATWANRSQAERNYRAARLRYDGAMSTVAANARSAYWDLYAAERDVAVSIVTRELALALLQEADVRAGAGLVGPNQVNNAKVFLADQELNLLDAQDNLTRVSDALASLIGKRPTGGERFKTLSEPPQVSFSEPQESLVARALRDNTDLKAAALDVEGVKDFANAAGWNALPKLDLFGTLGGNGLAGTGRDVIFGSDTLKNDLDTKFGDALDQALQRDYPSWVLGLRLSVPILRRGPQGEHNRLRAEVNRAEQRYVFMQRSLEEQVRAVYRELEQGRERLSLSEESVRASLDQVRIGLIEYKGGKTTAFELVRLGADLANAQRRYSRTLVRTVKAEAQLNALAPK